MPRSHGAWIRYGDPLTDDQVAFAAENYQVAILQPWETAALQQLKSARPDMTVLVYQCLSSTRSNETGDVITSGVGFEEAEEAGEHWFAHRPDGSRILWDRYPFHWQMAVWEPEYRDRWCDNVGDLLEGTRWDGVLADNDVFEDYYGLRPPLEGDRGMPEVRAGLDALVEQAGRRLQEAGRLLVPNIAESRREPGRWERHARFGGGYEEVFLAWGPEDFLDPETAIRQGEQVPGPGLTVLRTATDGSPDHPNAHYGLAAFWVFGGGRGGAYAATGHDAYSGTPFVPELRFDLGEPVEDAQRRGNGLSRAFTDGWAAVNLNSAKRRTITWSVPPGLVGADGEPAPPKVAVPPHHGVIYVRS